jgi:hypothetical protein
MHSNRRDQAIADPQRVVAKVLESAAERARPTALLTADPTMGSAKPSFIARILSGQTIVRRY